MNGRWSTISRIACVALALLGTTLTAPPARADGSIVTAAKPTLIEAKLTELGLKFSKPNAETWAVELGTGLDKINKGTRPSISRGPAWTTTAIRPSNRNSSGSQA